MKFVWNTYLQPKIDYYSQLWGPTSGRNLTKLENLMRSFTTKIEGIKHLDYWEILQLLDISSIGRRLERYCCIYTWKNITGNTLNCNIQWEVTENSGTLGKTIKVRKYLKSLCSH